MVTQQHVNTHCDAMAAPESNKPQPLPGDELRHVLERLFDTDSMEPRVAWFVAEASAREADLEASMAAKNRLDAAIDRLKEEKAQLSAAMETLQQHKSALTAQNVRLRKATEQANQSLARFAASGGNER